MLRTHIGNAYEAWLRATTPYTAAEPQAAHFRAQQLRACIELTPWVVFANFMNVVAVVSVSAADLVGPSLLIWAALVVLGAGVGIRPWLVVRAGTARPTASLRTLRRLVRNAALLGIIWAVAPVYFMPHLDDVGQKTILAICVGMMAAGAFVFASMPRAAIVYATILGAGMAAGLLLTDPLRLQWIAALVFTYLGIIIASVRALARNFGRRLMAEADAARQTELVGLLLNDFEQNSSDWLWEVDATGRLDHVSVRLAAALCRPQQDLMGAKLVELIASTLPRPTDEEQQALEAWRRALSEPQPFRDLAVPVLVADERQWWAMSGKPLLDASGQLTGWRGVGSDVTRSRSDHAEMARLANFDALTGLANRHQFQTRVALLGERPCTLFYLDLDNFKAANDFHGHAVGDRVLQVVAGRFQGQVRYGDLLARLGGDEFALISWGTSSTEAATDLAERLIDTLREPLSIQGTQIQVGTSIGIVRSSDAAAAPDDLLKFADMALYAAKDAGRNTYRFFQPDMNETARRRLSLVNDLHVAVKAQQFELYFQPLVHLRTGELVGAEALIRWHHPVLGMVPPLEFISLAEESGLILTIGAWALETACREALRWPDHLRVAVNLSAVQFGQRDLVDTVAVTLASTGLPPRRLELEITESLLIEDSLMARQALQSLRALGVRIALDDFGTGYSSLAYLRSFPLDKLKIDGSFVRSLAEDDESYAIVRTIVQLAKALRLDITAECIETAEQFEALNQLGCTDAQGYWMARPVTADAVLALMAGWTAIGPIVSERASQLGALNSLPSEAQRLAASA